MVNAISNGPVQGPTTTHVELHRIRQPLFPSTNSSISSSAASPSWIKRAWNWLVTFLSSLCCFSKKKEEPAAAPRADTPSVITTNLTPPTTPSSVTSQTFPAVSSPATNTPPPAAPPPPPASPYFPPVTSGIVPRLYPTFASLPPRGAQMQVAMVADMNGTSFFVIHGNLLQQDVRAIVNAANEGCVGGAGIDGQISRAGGTPMQAAREALPEVRPGVRCPTGEARLTISGDLSQPRTVGRSTIPGIDYVIHAVGSIYGTPDAERNLVAAYQSSLELAYNFRKPEDPNYRIRSIAFPLISGGIYGWPTGEATRVAIEAIQDFCERHPNAFSEILLAHIDEQAYRQMTTTCNFLAQDQGDRLTVRRL